MRPKLVTSLPVQFWEFRLIQKFSLVSGSGALVEGALCSGASVLFAGCVVRGTGLAVFIVGLYRSWGSRVN